MRLAALLAKGASGDPTAVPAHAALQMATLARRERWASTSAIGSLAPGKRADITAVRLVGLELAPLLRPACRIWSTPPAAST